MALVVSADGSTPIGLATPPGGDSQPVRWRDATMSPLPTAQRAAEPAAVSRSGDVVVGWIAESATSSVPIVWRGDSEPSTLPLPEGMTNGRAFATSRDGSRIAGCGGTQCATIVRWTDDKPAIVAAPRDFYLAHHAMSEDGAVLVGTVLAGVAEGVRLGPGSAQERLGADSLVDGVSDDGTIAVGSRAYKATLWRGATPIDLGLLPGHSSCTAVAVSADGGRVVGNCTSASGTDGKPGMTAFVWDKKQGLRSVADALSKAGVTLPDGVALPEVMDICGYGLTLVGRATRASGEPTTEAWLAILPR